MSEQTIATVTLDRKQIAAAMWDTWQGRHYLAVSPNGTWAIHWAEQNRQWDPWPDDSHVAQIPALFPDGSGEESEAAIDMMKETKDLDRDELYRMAEESEAYDGNVVAMAEAEYPELWADWKQEMQNWLLDEFLMALNNGSGNNLDLIWGTTIGFDGQLIENELPPFNFVYGN